MRETVPAGVARDDLFSAVAPFLEFAASKLPAIPAVPGLRVQVLLQSDPLCVRLLLDGPETALEALRLVGSEVPGDLELADAVAQFIAAGLSACPPEVVAGIMSHAEKPGAGLLLWLDPASLSVSCLLAPSRVPLSRATRLFSVEDGASAAEPSAQTFTVH